MAAPVLLGVPDIAIETDTSWEINKIGGAPDPLVQLPPVVCAVCGRRMPLVLQIYCPLTLSPFHRVLHIFTCVNNTCWNTTHGWRVYRSQKIDTTTTSKSSSTNKNSVAMETSDWCDEADDWGSDEDSADLVAMVADKSSKPSDIPTSEVSDSEKNPQDLFSNVSCFDSSGWARHTDSPIPSNNSESSVDSTSLEDGVLSQLDDLQVSDSKREVIAEDNQPDKDVVENALGYLATAGACANNSIPTNHCDQESLNSTEHTHFKPYYLDVFDEPANDSSESGHVTKLLKEYERRERVDVGAMEDDNRGDGKRGSGEKYEKTELKHGDKFFHKFMKRLRVCPQQVVRYQYGGCPLPITRPHGNTSPPPCQSCGAQRVFELQLLPPLISYMVTPNSKGPAVEFGTVMVFTCSQSCWEGSLLPREEFVITQPDPDQHLFKR